MRGLFPQPSEVRSGPDDALPKMSLPNAVDDNARRQRIILAGDSFGQFQPAATLFKLSRFSFSGKNGQPAARCFLAKIGAIPANVNLLIPRLLTVGHGV